MEIKLNKNDTLDIKKFIKSILILLMVIYIILDIKSDFSVKVINNPPIKYENCKIEYEDYIVQSGDTLWEIAEYYYPDKDNREIVHLIKQDNFCDSNLKIGQVLKIRK